MPPKKNVEKMRLKTNELKPKRVRRKLIPQLPTHQVYSMPPINDPIETQTNNNQDNCIVDINVPENENTKMYATENHNPENVSPEPTRNKINDTEINGTLDNDTPEKLPPKPTKGRRSKAKASNTPQINTSKSDTPECDIEENVPTKPNRRRRSKGKSYNCNIEIDETHNVTSENEPAESEPPQNVTPKSVRGKRRKANTINCTRTNDTIDSDDSDNNIVESNITGCLPSKPVKGRHPKAKSNNATQVNDTPENDTYENNPKESDTPENLPPKPARGRRPKAKTENKIKPQLTKKVATPPAGESASIEDAPPKTAKEKAAAAYKRKQSDIQKLREQAELIRNQKKLELKIKLANEVIRKALEKKSLMVKGATGQLENGLENGTNTDTISVGPTDAVESNERVKNVAKVIKRANRKRALSTSTREPNKDVAKRKAIKRVYRKRAPPTDIRDIDLSEQVNNVSTGEEEVPKKRKRLSLIRKVAVEPPSGGIILDKHVNKEGMVEIRVTIPNNVAEASPPPPPPPSKPDVVSSRKNSGGSSSTCFSWTKDISSSSTTTCITVQSNDYVRIDKRLPIVRLVNVDEHIRRRAAADTLDGSSRGSPPRARSDCSSVTVGDLNVSQTLNLSTSSLTSVTTAPPAPAPPPSPPPALARLRRSVEALASKIKNCDLEMLNWIGDEDGSPISVAKQSHHLFDIFKYENEVLDCCKKIKRINGFASSVDDDRTREPNADPTECIDSDQRKRVNDVEQNTAVRRESGEIKMTEVDNAANEGKSPERGTEEDNEDDDALSLFAESITGLESSRKNSSLATSNAAAEEETDGRLNSMEDRDEDCVDFRTPSVSCRKQTADSSSTPNALVNSDILNRPENFRPSTKFGDSASNRFDGRSSSVNLRTRFDDYRDIRRTVSENTRTYNRRFGDYQDFDDREAEEELGGSSNRSSDLNNCIGGGTHSPRTSNTASCFDGGTSLKVSDNANSRMYDNQTDVSGDTSLGAENSSFTHFRQPAAITAGANKQTHAGLFHGVCIFNLTMRCKNTVCPYVHKHISVEMVGAKLRGMTDEGLHKELMYMLKWPLLQIKYGLCFVAECARRGRTQWLLDTVKHFIVKGNAKGRHYAAFCVEAAEAALLHLNDADLECCADQLRAHVHTNLCLCDYLMKIISETQNFSRFKNVFIKLTDFICEMGRSFKLDVATQVLERLCILPYDEALAHALIEIIKKTNPSIFRQQMMQLLELQLAKRNPQLLEELGLARRAAGLGAQPSPPAESPALLLGAAPPARAVSPDTTNGDSVNQTVVPVITRTITIPHTLGTPAGRGGGGGAGVAAGGQYRGQRPVQHRRKFPLNNNNMVFNRLGFAPRPYSLQPAKYRHKPQQDTF